MRQRILAIAVRIRLGMADEIKYEKHVTKSDQGEKEIHFVPINECLEHSATRYCRCYPKAATFTTEGEMVFYHKVINQTH